jgi:hypothetical protein
MVRGVLFSVALSALLIYGLFRMVDMYQRVTPELIVRVDIYGDRITYRTNAYATPSLFAIGLKAAREPPRRIELHDCSQREVFEAVIDIVRSEGYSSFEIALPPDC